MLLAQHSAASVEYLLVEFAGGGEIPLRSERPGEVVERGERVGVLGAEDSAARVEALLLELASAGEIPPER